MQKAGKEVDLRPTRCGSGQAAPARAVSAGGGQKPHVPVCNPGGHLARVLPRGFLCGSVSSDFPWIPRWLFQTASSSPRPLAGRTDTRICRVQAS